MATRPVRCGRPVPAAAGIGLRAPHFERVLRERPRVAWLETHSENLFAAGGRLHSALERIREDYPLSLHGVGLSPGSADRLDTRHLHRLVAIVDRWQPALVSEHLCWGALGDRHSNDLLPLPFTREALDLMVARIGQVQDALGREILVENISSYLRFREADCTEWDFVASAPVERAARGAVRPRSARKGNGDRGDSLHRFVAALTAGDGALACHAKPQSSCPQSLRQSFNRPRRAARRRGHRHQGAS